MWQDTLALVGACWKRNMLKVTHQVLFCSATLSPRHVHGLIYRGMLQYTTDTLLIPTSFNMTFSPPLEYFCGYIFMQIPSKPLNHFRYPLVTQKWINVSSWQNIWFLGGIFSRLFLRCCTCVWQTYFRVFLWMCREELVYLCVHVWISLFHAEPSARGDNRHISLQTEAKQPFPAFSSWLRMTSSYYL